FLRMAGAQRARFSKLALACVCVWSGCTHGKRQAPGDSPGVSTPAVSVAPSKPESGVDLDWQAGRVPEAQLAGTPVSGGELVVRVDTDPPSLNTLIDPDALAGWMTRHRVYQGLVH